jgi:hypothetical protein
MTPEYVSRWAFLKARELLALDRLPAEIAAELKLLPATVVAIAAGDLTHSHLVIEEDDPLREEMLTARRCPECGGMVYVWPCLVCQMRNLPQPSRAAKNKVRDLKQKHRRRQGEKVGSGGAGRRGVIRGVRSRLLR